MHWQPKITSGCILSRCPEAHMNCWRKALAGWAFHLINKDANQSALVLVEHRLNHSKDSVDEFSTFPKVLAKD